jgi:CO dehydrogenase maturation factor
VKGLLTAKRINELVDELQLEVDRRVLIINRVIGPEADELVQLARGYGVEVAGVVPQDDMVFRYDLQGRPVYELPVEAPSVTALFGILKSLQVP